MNTEKKWIKRVEQIVQSSFNVPMWSHLPVFPIERLSLSLALSLGIEPFELKVTKSDWVQADHILDGFGKDPYVIGIELTPLASPLFLVVAKDDVQTISSWTLQQPAPFDSNLQSAYFEFLMAKVLMAVDKEHVYPDLHPKFSSQKLPREDAFLIHLALYHGDFSCNVRLVCPASFYENFNNYMKKQPFSLLDYIHESSSPVSIPLEVGHVTMFLTEWKDVHVGDFIVLDHCTYHPNEKKGTLSLSLYQKPLFQAKIKDDGVKILDYIFYNESLYMKQEDPLSNKSHKNTEPLSPEEEVAGEMSFESQKEQLIQPDEIPLSIKVEIGKFQMSLQELMQLKPGNTIPLNVQADQGVTLTVENMAVAFGELLQLGDVLGVKITEVK